MANPRILGGSARGRELETPRTGTRPSPSRLREALFDILAFEPRGHFLDLYSGSGAIGLEAASRGWDTTCVELSRDAAAVIRRNATRLELTVTVAATDALKFAATHPDRFDVLFAAPPYPLDLDAIFTALLASGAVVAGGLYVLQHPTGLQIPPLPAPLADAHVRVKQYGSNALTLVRAPDG